MENENKDAKSADGGCCAKGKCGCCGAKALVALIVAGGVFAGGYFCGKHCARAEAVPAAAAPATK